jgi:hypothetical protein
MLGLLSACASDTSSNAADAAAPATFSQIYPLFFPLTTRGQCNYCHSLPPNDRSNGKLSMGEDRATAYAALVDKTSSSSTCGGDGAALIVPGDPAASLFYQKLLPEPACGGPMPLGGSPLPADQLEMVRSWIAAGAHDD